jgi:hypothetical protein
MSGRGIGWGCGLRIGNLVHRPLFLSRRSPVPDCCGKHCGGHSVKPGAAKTSESEIWFDYQQSGVSVEVVHSIPFQKEVAVGEKKEGQRMERRTFFKTVVGATALGISVLTRSAIKRSVVFFEIFIILVCCLGFAESICCYVGGDGVCLGEETVEACQEDCLSPGITIRELFAWDDMHDHTLDELGWTETSRAVLPNGVTVIRGGWDAGPFTTFNQEGNLQTIRLAETAAVYLPPHAYNEQTIPGIVNPVHVEEYVTGHYGVAAELAAHFRVAVIRHGGKAENCQNLGLANRGKLIKNMLTYAQYLNNNELADPITANFGLFLGKVNVLALTLLDRILEQEGCDLGDAAIMGGSKEGYAAWIASAVDSRIKMTMLGHFQLHDYITGFSAYEENSGCGEEEAGSQYRTCITTGPGGLTIRELTRFRDWLVNSPGGSAYNALFSPSSFVDLSYPENILFFGDVGACGMHDGHYFSPGAETPFLEGFSQRAWRYDRSNMTRPCNLSQLMANLVWSLVHHASIAHIPKIQSAWASVSGLAFTIYADISPEPAEVRLWFSYSDDREFDDPDNPAWMSLPMVFSDGYWRSEWIACPAGNQVGWYVEAEDNIMIGNSKIPVRDASPIRFLHELPPLKCDTPICSCEMIPDTVVLSRGQTLGFRATVTNGTGLSGAAYFVTKITGPSNKSYPPSGVLDGPFNIFLKPFGAKSAHLFRTVPGFVEPGTYVYQGYVGQDPGDIYDQCAFEFRVTE